MIRKSLRRLIAKSINYFRNLELKEAILLTVLIITGFTLVFIFGFSIYKFPHVVDKKVEVFREGIWGWVRTINPLFAQNQNEASIAFLLYPPLLSFVDFSSPVLRMIKKSDDGLKYFVQINPTIKWSDGVNFSIEDVVFSFEMAKNFGQKSLRDFIKDVDFEIIDNENGVFKLKFIDNLFLERLSRINVLPAHWWKKFPQDSWFDNKDLFATGLYYYLKKFEQDKIVLSKNPYFSNLAIDNFVFVIYDDYISALHALILGEIDALADVRIESLSLISPKRFKIYRSTTPQIIIVVLNSEKNNKNIFLDRREKEKLVRLGEFDYGEILNGLFPLALRRLLNIPNLMSSSLPESTSSVKISVPSEGIFLLIAKNLSEKKGVEIVYFNPKDLQKVVESKDYEALLLGIDYGFPPNLAYFWSKIGLNLNNQKENKLLEKEIHDLILGFNANLPQLWQDLENNLLSDNQNIPIIAPYFVYVVDNKINSEIPDFLPAANYRYLNIQKWR